VLGVNPDTVESHAKWKRKLDIPYPLLADTAHAAAEAYGVWVEKSTMGRKYMGVTRTTFLIDETGTIVKVFPQVKVQGHSAEVLTALREMG
jgi:peroxiredoxin Q/BCP